MASLSERDYRGILEVLKAAGDAHGTNPFPEPVLEALRALVPCDVVAYHERRNAWDSPAIVFSGHPRAPVTAEIRAAIRRYIDQDPLVPADGARTISDVVSRREYHRRELYQYADRPLGIEYMMRLWIDPSGAAGARLEFDRLAPDFDERDRAVLDLLLPYLRQFRQAAALRPPEPALESNCHRISDREREILAHVAEGRTNDEIAWRLGISAGTVRKHLERAYKKLGVHTRTGAVAALRKQQ